MMMKSNNEIIRPSQPPPLLRISFLPFSEREMSRCSAGKFGVRPRTPAWPAEQFSPGKV